MSVLTRLKPRSITPSKGHISALEILMAISRSSILIAFLIILQYFTASVNAQSFGCQPETGCNCKYNNSCLECDPCPSSCQCGQDSLGHCNLCDSKKPTATPAPWSVGGYRAIYGGSGNADTIKSAPVTVRKKIRPELYATALDGGSGGYNISSLSTVISGPGQSAQGYSERILNSTYIASVKVPTNWEVFSTVCKNKYDCHSDTSPRSSNPVELALGPEGGYTDIWWHFVAPPKDLKALCNSSGTQASLSWNGGSGISMYPIRLDDKSDGADFACDPNSSGPTNVCREITGSTSYTANVARWHKYDFWLHSGNFWNTFASKSFVCGPAPNAFLQIQAPSCQKIPGKYEDTAVNFNATAVSSTGLEEANIYIAKECGSILCEYTRSSPAQWCLAVRGDMPYSAGTGIGSFCNIKKQSFDGVTTTSQGFVAQWKPTDIGVFYAMINAKSSNPSVFSCSGNPRCEYSKSSLVKYGTNSCESWRIASCQEGSETFKGKVANPETGDVWGESIRFEVVRAGSCVMPTATQTPAPTATRPPPTATPVPLCNQEMVDNTGGTSVYRAADRKAGNRSVQLWQDQSIINNIAKNTNYTFSFTATKVSGGNTTLSLSIGGQIIPLGALTGTKSFSRVWNSGNNTTASPAVVASYGPSTSPLNLSIRNISLSFPCPIPPTNTPTKTPTPTPTKTPTLTPTRTPTTNPLATNTPSPSPSPSPIPAVYAPWIKLKDTSFTRYSGATGVFTNIIPPVVEKFDNEDTAIAVMIGESFSGSGGFVGGKETYIKTGDRSSTTNKWVIGGGNYTMNSLFKSNLDEYVKRLISTKGANVVSSGVLTLDTVNTTTATQLGQISGGPAVLIAWNGTTLTDIEITTDPTSDPFLIIANKISLKGNIAAMNAILVSKTTIDLGGSGAPLKIKGNIISGGGLTGNRVRADGKNQKPSTFVIFDFDIYQELLQIISIPNITQ